MKMMMVLVQFLDIYSATTIVGIVKDDGNYGTNS